MGIYAQYGRALAEIAVVSKVGNEISHVLGSDERGLDENFMRTLDKGQGLLASLTMARREIYR